MAQIVCPLVSAEDRARLEAIVADRKRAQKHVARARIILGSARRLPVAEVARRAGVGRPAVWRWQRRFAEAGVEGLLRDATRKPGKAPLGDQTVRRVVTLTCAEPPGAATHWTGRAMARHTGISLRSVQRIRKTCRRYPLSGPLRIWPRRHGALWLPRVYQNSRTRQSTAIVIAPGNAMLADQLYRFAAHFAAGGMTTYIFDYRGYGGSGGIPYSNAIIHDYSEILSVVADRGHAEVYVYAMSFGGIVVLAALTETKQATALVLDGVPSELPWYAFCPNWLDPVAGIEHAPERTLVISGTDDPVIPPGDMTKLIRKARGRGMQAVLLEGFSHPGLDDPEKTVQRLEVVKEFLNKCCRKDQ